MVNDLKIISIFLTRANDLGLKLMSTDQHPGVHPEACYKCRCVNYVLSPLPPLSFSGLTLLLVQDLCTVRPWPATPPPWFPLNEGWALHLLATLIVDLGLSRSGPGLRSGWTGAYSSWLFPGWSFRPQAGPLPEATGKQFGYTESCLEAGLGGGEGVASLVCFLPGVGSGLPSVPGPGTCCY